MQKGAQTNIDWKLKHFSQKCALWGKLGASGTITPIPGIFLTCGIILHCTSRFNIYVQLKVVYAKKNWKAQESGLKS